MTDDLRLNEINSWIQNTKQNIDIIPKKTSNIDDFLGKYNIPHSTYIGTYFRNFGGMRIENGNAHILGCCGQSNLDNRDIMSWNNQFDHDPIRDFLLIGDNIAGAFFAINMGGIKSAEIGEICVLDPEETNWYSLEGEFSEFLFWSLSGEQLRGYEYCLHNTDLNSYETKEKVNRAWQYYPPLWTKEGSLEKSDRKLTLLHEIYKLRQLLG